MGNWKFWAVLAFLGGIGWAWYTGLIPDFLDQLSGGFAPSTNKVDLGE
jgi:hypothetical protein